MQKNNQKLEVEHYKVPLLRRTYFLLGLLVGYLPYCVHQLNSGAWL